VGGPSETLPRAEHFDDDSFTDGCRRYCVFVIVEPAAQPKLRFASELAELPIDRARVPANA
jgi:hypothetical protein